MPKHSSRLEKIMDEALDLLENIRSSRGMIQWRQHLQAVCRLLELQQSSGLSSCEFGVQLGLPRNLLDLFYRGLGVDGMPWPKLQSVLNSNPEDPRPFSARVFEDPIGDPQLAVLLEEVREILREMRYGVGPSSILWTQAPEKSDRLILLYSKSGLGVAEFTAAVEISPGSWSKFLRVKKYKGLHKYQEPSAKNKAVLAFLATGKTQMEASYEFGVTRQRISQIFRASQP